MQPHPHTPNSAPAAMGYPFRSRSRPTPPPPLALVPTQITDSGQLHTPPGLVNGHNANGPASNPSGLANGHPNRPPIVETPLAPNITTPLPLPITYASIHPQTHVHMNRHAGRHPHPHVNNGHGGRGGHTPTANTPIPLPLPSLGHNKKLPNGTNATLNGRITHANGPNALHPTPIPIPNPSPKGSFVGDGYFRMPDGWLVPLHCEWTRGGFVLVCQPPGVHGWQGFQVNVNVLINASLWFKNELVSPPEFGAPSITRSHVIVHEPLDVAELLLRFLHLGHDGHEASSLRPSLDQYFAVYHAFVRLQFKHSMCQVLVHHVNSFAGDLVDSLGRSASKGDVFKLLELARLLRSAGIWNAVLDSDYASHGWSVVHNPWDLEFDNVLHNNEAYNVLLLLQRMSVIDDAPLQEFRVAYDSHDRPYVYHQDSEGKKFSAC